MMLFERLSVDNIMGCKYDIEFGERDTTIIGKNRQGKTQVARLIMLVLFGLQEGRLHSSWKLRKGELLHLSNTGSVELIFINNGKRYKIRREFGSGSSPVLYIEKKGGWEDNNGIFVDLYTSDNSIKDKLEEMNITPTLMNVVMSNEQGQIGAIYYDDNLQTCVWEGYKWREDIIRENIKKAQERCGTEANDLRKNDIDDIKGRMILIKKGWIGHKVFKENDKIDKDIITQKINDIRDMIENLKTKEANYLYFNEKLIGMIDIDNKDAIESFIRVCEEKESLDEKEDIMNLKKKYKDYLEILKDVLSKDGKEGIQGRINSLVDEEKKLKSSKKLKYRKSLPVKVICDLYSPEGEENLIIQIPDEISEKLRYEDITKSEIAVRPDEYKEEEIRHDIKNLRDTIERFQVSQSTVKQEKEKLRTKISLKKTEISNRLQELMEQKIVLDTNNDQYLLYISDIEEKEKLVKKFEKARDIFREIYQRLDFEENLKKIRKATVDNVNKIYEDYGWDKRVILDDKGDKIVVVDKNGQHISHASGSESHILGLAWRWMIARSFDLPLVLDELESLLDPINLEKTQKLIREKMDRQIVILSLRGLNLHGREYEIEKKDDISTMKRLDNINKLDR